ncbi:YkgJ family cysteine cluster protein [Tautonia plasticadhaerens]|uniref:Flagellin N-methylase n=1 Tax=Tautonia plasticadhaerens TaxID=2527974 RepID=A0A518H4V5_9BACT|nr:YkgJ family cysteine cluster protein [Tautonia plasticadhaerens]QDV35858.1 Flagellin N-methylase [Tautonia plasticadhaerens]
MSRPRRPHRRRPRARRLRSRPARDGWSLEGLVSELLGRLDALLPPLPGDPPLGRLYRIVDAWAAERDAMWRRRSADAGLPIAPEPACATGCAHCCYQHVAVTGLEALTLADYVRGRWSAEEVAALRARLEGESARFRQIADDPKALARVRRPCPLLDEAGGRCRAYEARPVNCRRENSTDVEICRRYRADPEVEDSSLRLVRYDVIWGAARVALSRWTAGHLDPGSMMPLDVALASALGGVDAPAGRIRGDGGGSTDCDVES